MIAHRISKTAFSTTALSLLVGFALAQTPNSGDPGDLLGECFFAPGGSVIMAPGFTLGPDNARLGLSRVKPVTRYQLDNVFWNSTATDGGVSPIERFTLTYSYVPDGTIITGAGFVGDPTGPSDMFAMLDANFPGGREAWVPAMDSVFERWGELLAITFVKVSDDGAPLPGTPGALGARGDVRVAMHGFDPGFAAAAYNYTPNTADMVFNSDLIGLLTNPFRNFVILKNVGMHELGHGLGMDHSSSDSVSILMKGNTPTDVDGPQDDDIRGGQVQYGDIFESNDTIETATDLDPLVRATLVLDAPLPIAEVAIEGDGEPDFYKITLPADSKLSVTLTPVGAVYGLGPDNDTFTTIDTTMIHDLSFEVIDPDMMTVLASVNEMGLGSAESIADLPLPKGQDAYFVKVDSETTSSADVQRYELEISVTSAVEASAMIWTLY